MQRRTLLISGGSSLIILGGLSTARLHSDLDKAQRPWRVAGTAYTDPRLKALSYAVLAPSPHNRQPWLVELTGTDGLTLFCDTARLLPETDPYNRQIAIGLGAFIHLLEIAAAEGGHSLEISYFPEGEPYPNFDERPVAHLRFVAAAGVAKDPLFSYVLSRRTNRARFTDKPVNLPTLEALGRSLSEGTKNVFSYTHEAASLQSIKDICVEGWSVEINTPRTHHESTGLTRIGETEINSKPDGVSLSGPMMEGLGLIGQLTVEKMNDPSSQAFKGTRTFYERLINSAQAFAWITTPDNGRMSQVQAGVDWLRLHLASTREGLAFQPLSQVLQEFPEMSKLHKAIHDLLGVDDPNIIQGLFRLGYAKLPPPAPRWPLQTRLLEISK